MFASQCCVCRCIHNTAFQVILTLMEDDLGERQHIIKKLWKRIFAGKQRSKIRYGHSLQNEN